MSLMYYSRSCERKYHCHRLIWFYICNMSCHWLTECNIRLRDSLDTFFGLIIYTYPKGEKELSYTSIPLIHPTLKALKQYAAPRHSFNPFDIIPSSFKDLKLVYSSHSRWIGNKSILGQVFILDGWEARSYLIIFSLLLREHIWILSVENGENKSIWSKRVAWNLCNVFRRWSRGNTEQCKLFQKFIPCTLLGQCY